MFSEVKVTTFFLQTIFFAKKNRLQNVKKQMLSKSPKNERHPHAFANPITRQYILKIRLQE